MTRIVRDVMASFLVALILAAAISLVWFAMMNRAHADGLQGPPPPPGYPPPTYYIDPPPLWSIPAPMVQGPPMRSCIETAIQLAYQTGSREVGNNAAEACKYFAPVQVPQPGRFYGAGVHVPPLGPPQ